MQTVLRSINSKGATGKFRSTSHHLCVVWWLCMHAAFALPLDIPSKSLYWDYHESWCPILHVGTSGLKLTSLHAIFSWFNLSLLAAVKLVSCDVWKTQTWVGKSSTFSLQATNSISACQSLSEPLPIRRSVSFMHSVWSHSMLRRCAIFEVVRRTKVSAIYAGLGSQVRLCLQQNHGTNQARAHQAFGDRTWSVAQLLCTTSRRPNWLPLLLY